MITRRLLLQSLASAAGATAIPAGQKPAILKYLETLARADGGYAFADEPHSAVTPTFAAVACCRLLKEEPPQKSAIGAFVRSHYPLQEARHKDRPLHRFDFEQIQTLLWLGQDVESFRPEVESWTGPSRYTTSYEHGGNPVFQNEVAALCCREMLGVAGADSREWRDYILARRRANGTFNNTPAADGSDGHVVNTWWGLTALKVLKESAMQSEETVRWLRSCQRTGGGFTYAPRAEIGAVDHVVYTWAAVHALHALNAKPADRSGCIAYLRSLWNEDGGSGDRPGTPSNPLATWQALEALQLLGAMPERPRQTRRAKKQLPAGLKVFTIQIEAPGWGSPAEAVEMARALRIHLWGAKNSEPGWVARAQEIAKERKAPVTFFVANEEYGTYVTVPGLGTYSHLSDLAVPDGVDFGRPMSDPKSPTPWPKFRDERIGALQRARGRMVWQFNENEELSRVLLDEAVERGTYAAISSFHFGKENFLQTQPFLNRYRGLLPFIGLQDAHGRESWWWGDVLAAFRTVFLAKEPTWEAWLEALREDHVVSIRHDTVTQFETQYAGSSNEVREFVRRHEREWRWWGNQPERILRPLASVVPVTPEDRFDVGRPEKGVAVRIRCWWATTNLGGPLKPVTELAELKVDGAVVKPEFIQKKTERGGLSDCYHLWPIAEPTRGKHTAVATVRRTETGEMVKVAAEF
jgi:hypothetical protein